MIECDRFCEALEQRGVEFYAGVPDSLLKNICAHIQGELPAERHIIAANEGAAVALAAGYHLATGKYGVAYMQNSGQGNAINPLASLVDPEVYAIPVLLLIGWRGQPGTPDEPQHVKQGRVTLPLLETLDVPYGVLSREPDALAPLLDDAFSHLAAGRTFALVAPKGVFGKANTGAAEAEPALEMSREQALQLILRELSPDDVVVSTTGKASREVFEHRAAHEQGHFRDFLTVGSMGHASQIALGAALGRPNREVFCLDGDGALIMHMGALAIIGQSDAHNFRHVLINNGAHDSVGGQPTVGFEVDFVAMALASGYKDAVAVDTLAGLREGIARLKTAEGPRLLEVRVRKGARADLGRPTRTPVQNKIDFMAFLERDA